MIRKAKMGISPTYSCSTKKVEREAAPKKTIQKIGKKTLKNKVLFDEGCLSVPDQNGEVLRPKEIKLTFQNKDGKYKKWKLDGIAARVVQHEIDHLDGILFVDYLDAKDN